MKKHHLIYLVLAAGGAALVLKALSQKPPPPPPPEIKLDPATPMPTGTHYTGNIQRTTNNRPPNYPGDAVGYGVHDWAEVADANGKTSWVMIAAQ